MKNTYLSFKALCSLALLFCFAPNEILHAKISSVSFTNSYGKIVNSSAFMPVAVDDDLVVKVNSSAGTANQIDVSTNDTNSSTGTHSTNDYSINTIPANGVVTEISDGVFQYIPNTNFIGADSFTYQFCDSNGACSTATVNVDVNFEVCVPQSLTDSQYYITNVNLVGEETTSINHNSGFDSGYGNYITTPTANLYLNKTYSIAVSVSLPVAINNRSGWAVFIDLNHDGDFTDADEELYGSSDNSLSPTKTTYDLQNITIPASASVGLTVMRVGFREESFYSNRPCGRNNRTEEFEDYTINIQPDPFSLPEINVFGNGILIDNMATATSPNNSTDFGVNDIFTNNPSQKTFTITNTGGLDLLLPGALPVTITGSTDFTVVAQPASTLSASNSTTFTIAFAPTAPIIGLRTATVSIANNDSDESPYTFNIQGFGEQTFPDTDGDGVPDNVDLDDDNDGIMDTIEQSSCTGNSVSTVTNVVFLNEDFGNGTARDFIAGATYCYEDGTGTCGSSIDLNDGAHVVYYRAANGDGINQTPIGEVASFADRIWYPGLDHTPNDINGRMAMFNAAEDPGVFYVTTISGVNAGVDVTYGFSALNLDRADAACVDGTGVDNNGNPCSGIPREKPSVLIEILDPTGAVITSSSSGLIEPTTNISTGDWVSVSATFNSPFTQFTVRLSNENLGGLGNDLAIDDIFVTQTLCDLDGDGVEDSIDLDNDNDGIPNVVELQLVDTDRDGTVDNDTGAFAWVDVNNNGLHDLYDPQDASGRNPGDSGFTVALGIPIDLSNPIYDTDGDGVLDYVDLDSDNDGIFDAVEYDNRGDLDVNGDGIGDGLDKNILDSDGNSIDNDAFDGDGILDLADANDDDADNLDHGTGNAYPTPLDDDNDGIPNFRDVDSADSPNDFSNGSDIDTTEIYADLDANNDGVLDDTVDTDNDGILDIFDTDNTIYGSPRRLNNSHSLFFDGINDYVEEASVINGWANATLMSWVKIQPGTTAKRVVVGQNEIQLYITNTGNISAVANGNTITSASTIAQGIWVHIAAVYDGINGAFTLYVNGEQDATTAVSGALPNDVSSFTIGRTPNTNSNYFHGEIDEVRVFTKALTALELQRMVYQELASAQRGVIVPIDISPTLAGTLSRYYKMDVFTSDITDNGAGGAKLFNIKNIYFQTAPLPYVTMANGDWSSNATWLYGQVWDITDEVNNKDWSIVHIKHNTTTSNRHGTVGLIVDSGSELEINGDQELQNSWYLNLNGEIDLQGESQLIQTQNSRLTGTGNLERDQQGNVDKFTYNYWSSPVHSSNPDAVIDGNETYSVSSVLKDGKDPQNPQTIDFITGANYDGDGSATPNIQIADFWIWKFNNRLSDDYSQWQHVRSGGALLVGEGYTMKGPGAGPSGIGNYVFSGTPNNGEINLFTNGGNAYLVGNPYPSAIDGAEFLNDNPHLDGTLYFWEHYGGASHLLREYQGGYGLYNFSGGTPPLEGALAKPDPDVNQTGGGLLTPKRYIPVGQGFFVNATSNGDIKFENDQRIFVKEAGGTNSVFFKQSTNKKTELSNLEDDRPKIRINYTSPKGYKRQLLVTVDENASSGIDWGYEGPLTEDNVEDMYWRISDANYIIQGIGELDPLTTRLPLGLKTQQDGAIQIAISSTENLDDDIEILLRDKTNNVYHDLRKSKFVGVNTQGVNDDRFEIVFSSQSVLSNTEFEIDNQTGLFYDKANQNLVILNPAQTQIKTLKLYNTLGQIVFEKHVNSSKNRIEISANIASSVYVTKITGVNLKVFKKLIINNY